MGTMIRRRNALRGCNINAGIYAVSSLMRGLLCVAILLALSACGGSGGPEAGPAAGADAGREAGADAGAPFGGEEIPGVELPGDPGPPPKRTPRRMVRSPA